MSLRFGNPYAPPWMGFTPVLPGIRDQEYDLDLPAVAVPNGQFVTGLQLPVDNDADFLVREIQFVVIGASTVTAAPPDLRVRIRDGEGKLFTSDYVPCVDLNGPLVPPWPIRRGSVLIIDYQNINATAETEETVWMLLRGWKRKSCVDNRSLTPDYVPMYNLYPKPNPDEEFEDFEYPQVFTFTAPGFFPKLPLVTDNDADFWWCGLTGDWNTANNDVAVVGSVACTFYDAVGLPMLQYPLTNPWGLPGGLFRESIFSSGGGRPAPHFPAVFIPRGSVTSVDISVGQACTLRFSQRGYKVYPKVCQ